MLVVTFVSPKLTFTNSLDPDQVQYIEDYSNFWNEYAIYFIKWSEGMNEIYIFPVHLMK